MPKTTPTVRTCPRGHTYRKSSDCAVCPKCAREEKQRHLADFPPKIGSPALSALRAEGITKLAHLAKRRESEIAALHGMGPKALGLLKIEMKSRGLSFR